MVSDKECLDLTVVVRYQAAQPTGRFVAYSSFPCHNSCFFPCFSALVEVLVVGVWLHWQFFLRVQNLPDLLMTVAVASSTPPKKFSTERRKVNSTPTSSAVAFRSAMREPWKGARESSSAAEAAALAPALAETFQEAEIVREAEPEEARPSRRRLPQRPTVWNIFEKEEMLVQPSTIILPVTPARGTVTTNRRPNSRNALISSSGATAKD